MSTKRRKKRTVVLSGRGECDLACLHMSIDTACVCGELEDAMKGCRCIAPQKRPRCKQQYLSIVVMERQNYCEVEV